MSWVHCVAFSPDGSLFLTSSDDQTIRVRCRLSILKNVNLYYQIMRLQSCFL